VKKDERQCGASVIIITMIAITTTIQIIMLTTMIIK